MPPFIDFMLMKPTSCSRQRGSSSSAGSRVMKLKGNIMVSKRSGLHQGLGDVDLVRGGADVQDFTRFLESFEDLVQAALGVEHLVHGREIAYLVELVEVDIVDAEAFEGKVEVLFDVLAGASAGLGGEIDLVAVSADGLADPLFAGGVAVGGVVEVDAVLQAALNHADGVVLAEALYGDTPEPQPGHHHARFAKLDFFHVLPVT